jgi:hypothetical protein
MPYHRALDTLVSLLFLGLAATLTVATVVI